MSEQTQVPGWAQRIAAAAAALDRSKQTVRDDQVIRDQAIADAVDEGHSLRTVARYANIGHPAVLRTLAASGRFATADTSDGNHD